MMCEEIIGEGTVMDVVPGDTNTELLKETLADILPSDEWSFVRVRDDWGDNK